MKRIPLSVICLTSIIFMVLLIMCRDVPTNPADEPDNVTASFMILNSLGTNYQDQPFASCV